tara:strand:+ start:15955 stop:16134 length:180 start_codon:yes stop_codon:yes gene_type:complete
MVDDASKSVNQLLVVHGQVVMDLMQRSDFTHEQKLAIIEMLKPIEDASKVALSKFVYAV